MTPENFVQWLTGYFSLSGDIPKYDNVQLLIKEKLADTSISNQNFCYWLQGYYELNRDYLVGNVVWHRIVRDHLKLVFNKQTPLYPPNPPVYPTQPTPFMSTPAYPYHETGDFVSIPPNITIC